VIQSISTLVEHTTRKQPKENGVLQYGSEADDFEFEDSGATIEVSPENSTTCDQQVNQAASAFGK
jgi:hypothetical protein